jgi:transcriptional regulator with XRE-family HTH domain
MRKTSAPRPDEIRASRESGGFTQVEFAEMIGVHPSSIQKWESGASRPRGLTLERLREHMTVVGSSGDSLRARLDDSTRRSPSDLAALIRLLAGVDRRNNGDGVPPELVDLIQDLSERLDRLERECRKAD